ncbi:MAG: ATP-dependent metallopeptidase FtsH/Yme1/Tma family protein, partial [Actinomycetes bacterium]
MDVKRYFRGPFFWVTMVILGVLLVTSISSAAGGFKQVDTAVALKAITDGRVAEAKLVDRDQRIELTLKDGEFEEESGKIQADYVDARQRQLIRLLDENLPDSYTDHVPRTSWVVSLFINFLPILILVLLFLFF